MSHSLPHPIDDISAYHAHVYFDDDSTEFATQLCQQAWLQFHISLGRRHAGPVGPHPVASCQLAFAADQFTALIPWLAANRGDLTVLVHGLSGDDWADHTTHAQWLGTPAELNLAMFEPAADNP